MELKRFLVNKLILFFMLSTLIAVAVFLIGSAFDSSARLGYDALLVPIEYAALCMLPTLVMWSKRELSARELLVRKALMLVLLEGVILFIAFTSPVIDTSSVRIVLTIAGSVLIIFVLANLFLWLKNFAEAKNISRDLEQFQKLHQADGDVAI
jgi:FtsH-binding integral membrane protein